MSTTLDNLPTEIARHRILNTRETCEFVGISIAEWRKMRGREGAPPPIMLGTQRQGWRVGDLIDWLASRALTDKTGDAVLKVAERKLEELGRAVAAGHVDRAVALRRLEQVARQTGLTLEQTAAA